MGSFQCEQGKPPGAALAARGARCVQRDKERTFREGENSPIPAEWGVSRLSRRVREGVEQQLNLLGPGDQ